MSRLIESIRLIDGRFCRLSLHQDRINHSCISLFGKIPDWKVVEVIEESTFPKNGLYKFRIVYDVTSFKAEFEAYHPKEIKSLKLVEANNLSYDHKFEDRKMINNLFEKRDDCDDVLLHKNGMIMDTSYANVCFYRDNRWITPTTFFLNGTMRQYLLQSNLISEEPVSVDEIRNFQDFRIINSMLEWNSPSISIENIR